jgi:alanine or glycine:cation symporter, AGCS family
MIQANSITQSVQETGRSIGFDIPGWSVGLTVAILAFAVIIGGIKSIGAVAGKLVPFMAIAYVLSALVVLVLNYEHIGDAFALIFRAAFGLEQAVGGVAGYGVLAAIRAGVARGLFSNEAGQGSAAIAHAAAKTNSPVRQGEIAMVGVFIDTLVICTMTALVILVVDGAYVSGGGTTTVEYAWQSTDLQASAITTAAFAQGIAGGAWIVLSAQMLFAFTTIIGWSYYGEQCIGYLFGDRSAVPFRYVWVVFVFIGTLIVNVDGLWLLGDVANSLMLFPNVVAIVALSGLVFAMAREADRAGKV